MPLKVSSNNMKDFIPNLNLTPLLPHLDWFVGAETGIKYEERCSNWTPYLPTNERQNRGFETFSCVSFSALNIIEMQIKYLYMTGAMNEDTLKYLKDVYDMNDNGDVNFSDRYIAILSGTTRQGNSGNNVAETIRKYGLIPDKILPFEGDNFDEFMNKNAVTDEMIFLGKQFLVKSGLNYAYEWVYIYGDKANAFDVLSKHIKQAPLQIFSPICPGWSYDRPVKTCPSNIPQHATLVYNVNQLIEILDQYEPFYKQLDKDYPILYALKIVITVAPVKQEQTKPTYNWKTLLDNGFTFKKGDKGDIIKEIQKVLVYEGCLNENLVTGNFFDLTEIAVKKFQEKHRLQILIPIFRWNGTGVVGKMTLKYLAENYQS